jgi:predicted anti-sigma-YlaC factor YlaD
MMKIIEISCIEVWRELSNYLEGAVDPEMRARLEAHFSVCKHCTAILDGTRNVVELLAEGEAFEVSAGFGERLFKKLK